MIVNIKHDTDGRKITLMKTIKLFSRTEVDKPSGSVYQLSRDVRKRHLLSCQPRVTVTSCFVFKVIRDLKSIDHLCINPIHRIGLIHK